MPRIKYSPDKSIMFYTLSNKLAVAKNQND